MSRLIPPKCCCSVTTKKDLFSFIWPFKNKVCVIFLAVLYTRKYSTDSDTVIFSLWIRTFSPTHLKMQYRTMALWLSQTICVAPEPYPLEHRYHRISNQAQVLGTYLHGNQWPESRVSRSPTSALGWRLWSTILLLWPQWKILQERQFLFVEETAFSEVGPAAEVRTSMNLIALCCQHKVCGFNLAFSNMNV